MIQGSNILQLLLPAIIFSVCCLSPLSCAHRAKSSHREAIETLLEIADMEEISRESLDQMAALHMQQDPRLGPYEDTLKKFYGKYMSWESLKEDFIAIYMEEFSEDEIRELIAFYKTPAGRKAIKKMPDLMARCARIGNRRVLDNMPEWNQMLQEKTNKLKELQDRRAAPPQAVGKGPGAPVEDR